MSYILDSNVIINYLQGSIPAKGFQLLGSIVDDDPTISVITKIEILGFNFSSIAEEDVAETFINGSMILNIEEEIVEQTIQIRKAGKIKLPDAIIAATAIVHNRVLITRNIKDFSKIDGLKIINPFES